METDEQLDVGAETIRTRILHTLKVYPRISPSMLQISIGTAVPSSMWRPILTQLLEDKTIKQEDVQIESPSGRTRTYTILSLNDSLD